MGPTVNYPTIGQANLYVNNVFTHSTLHDIYVNNVGYTLIRIHKSYKSSFNTKQTKILLSSFKYPIEYAYVGVLPEENVLTSNPHHTTDWHKFLKRHH